MRNIERKRKKELWDEDEEIQKRYKELCNEDWYKEVKKRCSIMNCFRRSIMICIAVPGCFGIAGYVDAAIVCYAIITCALLLLVGVLLIQIILERVRKTEDLETGGESNETKKNLY